jgi:hypothetical protein
MAANIFTHQGKAITAGRVKGSAANEPNKIGYGTGATDHVAGDTALQTERTVEARLTGTSSLVTTTQTNDTYQVTGTWTKSDAGTAAITEAGLVTQARGAGAAVPGGDEWLALFTFAAINASQNDSIAYTIKVVYS